MGRSPRTVQQFEIYHSPVFLSPRARSTDKKASRLDYYIKCKYSRDKEITLLTTSLPPPLPPPYSLSLEKLLVLCLSLTFYPIPPPPSRIKSIRCFPRDLRLFRGSLESASSSSRREGPTRKSKGKHGCYLGSFPSPLRRSAADSCFNEEEWAGASIRGGGKRAYQAVSLTTVMDRRLYSIAYYFEKFHGSRIISGRYSSTVIGFGKFHLRLSCVVSWIGNSLAFDCGHWSFENEEGLND